MDRRNALMDYYTTADVLNTPINRGGVLPLTEYADRVEFDPSSGLLGSIMQALTAPGRAYRGEMTDDQMIPEAMNFAGMAAGGGAAATAAQPARNSAMAAMKAMGPADAPANALQIARIAGANRFLLDDSATAFANRSPSTLTGEDLLQALYNAGKGPANSNSATAELFANGKNGMAPGVVMSEAGQNAIVAGGGNKMAPRPEPRGAFPKAEAMGSDHIAEIAPDKYNAFLAGVESRLDNGEWGPFYGPPTPGTNPGSVRDAYARTAASFKNDKYDKFSDQEQIAYGLEAAAKEAGRDLKMGAGGFYGSMYGDLLTPAGGQYKVRVADHANFSSAHGAPDFNIAPGAMTPDEFLDLLPTIYSNGRNSLAPGAVMTEAAKRAEPQGIKAFHGSPHDFDKFDINADPNDFLDWDKPLSQQSEKVRGALTAEAMGLKPNTVTNSAGQQFSGWVDADGKLVGQGIKGADPPTNFIPDYVLNNPNVMPQNLVKSYLAGDDSARASKYLREAGIPGIRYLDQGSRGAGEGSSNYVVFDDSLIEILRKYGLLGPVAAGLAASQQDEKVY